MAPPPPPTPLSEIASGFLRDLGLLLGRVLAAWVLVIFHAWGEIGAGYRHFFGPKDPWPLSEAIAQTVLPAPLPVAVVLTVSLWAVAIAFAAGLLTRVAALVLLLVAAMTSVVAPDQVQESAAAYAAVAVILLLAGPGRFSLDALVARRRTPKPQPKYREVIK
jgi:putative oxidoreductase